MKSDIFKLLHIIRERHPECSIDWRRDVTVNPMMGINEPIVGQQRLLITFPFDEDIDPIKNPVTKTVKYCGFDVVDCVSVYHQFHGNNTTLEITI